MYATAQSVTVEEAVRRLDLQDEIGELGRVLAERERATFAGLWIEHQPKYRVVAAFTRGGEATLRPYLENSPLADLLDVQTARVTLAQLEADQAEAGRIARELKMRVNTSTDVPNNQVELWVGERAAFEAALRAANLTLPDTVVIVGNKIQWNNGRPDVAATASALDLHFPQLKPGPRVYMAALLLGQLVAVDGCLRVIEPNGESVLIIWQPDVAPDVEAGVVVIRRADGSVAARVGDNVRFGGGAVRPADDDLIAPLPAACAGPYWVSGDLAVDVPPSPTPPPTKPERRISPRSGSLSSPHSAPSARSRSASRRRPVQWGARRVGSSAPRRHRRPAPARQRQLQPGTRSGCRQPPRPRSWRSRRAAR